MVLKVELKVGLIELQSMLTIKENVMEKELEVCVLSNKLYIRQKNGDRLYLAEIIVFCLS